MIAGMMPGGPSGVSGGPSPHAQAHLNPGHPGQMFPNQPQMQGISEFDLFHYHNAREVEVAALSNTKPFQIFALHS